MGLFDRFKNTSAKGAPSNAVPDMPEANPFDELRYKTVGMVSPQRKPSVFFSCHKDDFAEHFERLSNLVLKIIDATIWYYPPDIDAAEDVRKEALGEMRLLIIPVSERLLRSPNAAVDIDLPYARQHGIPVLPVMVASGLEDAYTGIFGNLQYLDSVSKDQTAIQFEQKLAAYLNDILISDELSNKIRAAFDAYIFLSYRKKDRRSAKELMELIHAEPFFRDVAIWYDEYLVPGESFSDAISNAMKNSQLFALAVTPNLVNETNYVMTTEYPEAIRLNMPVIGVELKRTDGEALKRLFQRLPSIVNPQDKKALSDALKEGLKTIALQTNDDPQHLYYMGLAYLSGIDVEVNHKRALHLLETAAEAEYYAAMDKLGSMFITGNGVPVDYDKSIMWRKKLVEAAQAKYRENSIYANRVTYERSLDVLIGSLMRMLRMDEAKPYLRRQLEHYLPLTKTPVANHTAYHGVAQCHLLMGQIAMYELNYDEALRSIEQTADAMKESMVRISAQEQNSVTARLMQNARQILLAAYGTGADICTKARFNEDDKESLLAREYTERGVGYSERMLSVTEEMLQAEPQLQTRRNLAASYLSLANTLISDASYEKAEKHLENAEDTVSKLLEDGDNDKNTLHLQRMIQGSFGALRNKEGKYAAAYKHFVSSLEMLRSFGERFGYYEQLRVSIVLQLYNVATALFNNKRPAQAVPYLDEAIGMCDDMLQGASKPDVENWRKICMDLRARAEKQTASS